jgi:GntR family transcriptional regulator
MPTGFTPHYQRVIDAITDDIATGRLRPGDRLPSTAQLAEAYRFSPGTIRRAVDILLDRGVLRGHQGLGVFVADNPRGA